MSEAKREQLKQKCLSQLPADATEAERIVFEETQFCEYVEMIVSASPLTGYPDDSEILERVTGIRKRTVENVMKAAAHKFPGAHIALFSTSGESPIYVYN